MRVARARTRGEGIASSFVHGAGCVASLAALPVLIIAATRQKSPLYVAASAVFGASMVLLYMASTIYAVRWYASPGFASFA